MSLDFKTKGDLIFLIGETVNDIASSEYLVSYHKIQESPAPYFKLDKEFDLQETVKGLIDGRRINAAHDCADGGLYITLTEMAMVNDLGFDIVTDAEVREDAFLFGESQSRVVVGVNEDQEDDFLEFMMAQKVPYTLLGHVTKGKMCVDDVQFGFVNEIKEIYDNALEMALE